MTGVCPGSRSAARRLVEGGGVRVDGEVVREPSAVPDIGALVRVGKRCFVRVG